MPAIAQDTPPSSFASRTKSIFLAWLKKPSDVATICPSSPELTDRVSNRPSIAAADLVVELGPGTGETTAAILSHMRPGSKLLAIEKTKDFIKPLSEIQDPRLIVAHGDAADLSELLAQYHLGPPDVIVSGIPFSSMPKSTASGIVETIHKTLADQGSFIAYQLRGDIRRYATPLFGEPTVESVRWNLPPLRVYCWKK